LAASLALAAAALGAGATGWRLAARVRAASARNPPDGTFVEAGGIRLHVSVSGDGPVLVLLHGLSGSLRDFTFGLAPHLARTYRVIALDRPGHGWSGPVPGDTSLAAEARILREAAVRAGAAAPVVLGFSYGGAVALRWALDAPASLSGLVLAAPVSHPWDTGMSAYYHAISTPVLRHIAIPLIAAWAPASLVRRAVAETFRPDPLPAGYLDHFGPGLSLRPSVLRVTGRQRRRLRAEIASQAPLYPSLRLPVEIIHGTADDIVSHRIHSDRLVRDIPGACLTLVPGAGHMIHHAAPDEVVAAVARVMARAAP
jgi:pimeloyl-ACP methyl ester carboxylesterase